MRLGARIGQVCGEDQSLNGRWNDRVVPSPSNVSAAGIAIQGRRRLVIFEALSYEEKEWKQRCMEALQ